MQTNINSASKVSVRTVWISDVYLGFHGCSAKLLLDFLHHVDCDTPTLSAILLMSGK